ncbi:histidinol-phosphate transaminase [Flavobacteriaceae bacterium R38]|nr:histidinol-phosphate transaminase [Flavobacteriaceae bacterium R38]
MAKSFDIESFVRPNILKLKPYSSARDEYKDIDQDMTFLDANENPFENGVNRYPDPQQRDLKQQLAKIKRVTASQILLGNGSDEVLDLIFRAFCEPSSDNVITLPPTYGMYGVLADTNNISNKEVYLTPDFEPDVERILKSVDAHTKIIFLCSPNNPTGNSFSSASIQQILESFNGLVVVDEAYIDFSEKESWLSKLKEFPNLIVTQTLSKAYGVAGIRVGVCYASEEIISILNKIKPPYNVNKLSQEKALERVLDQERVKEEVKAILDEKEKMISKLENIFFIKTIYPSDGNFVLVRVDDADKRYQQLISSGVVIRNRSSQPLCENTLRLTIGTAQENEILIKALKNIE